MLIRELTNIIEQQYWHIILRWQHPMLPQKFKDMFGIKDEKDMKMANNIWKMLDEMSSNDPTAYQKFIHKNLTEGLADAKEEKEKKDKPYKLVPIEYMLLEMDAQLEEELATTSSEEEAKLKEKLDLNLNKDKWSDVRSKFPSRIRIFLNICHTDRVKKPTSKARTGQPIQDFQVSMIKDIENLYYSLQGPHFEKQSHKEKHKEHQEHKDQHKDNWYFCMIFNTSFLRAFDAVPNGRRLFLGICAAYFQERIKADRNPVLMKVNTQSLYGKNLYYGIDKLTIQVNQSRKFKYGELEKPCEFLLEQEVDEKQREKTVQQAKQKQVKNPDEILIKPPKQVQQQLLGSVVAPQPQKKILIEELSSTQTNEEQETIPYQMKQTEEGYTLQFLVVGVRTIQQLDLQVNCHAVKLQAKGKAVEVGLSRAIDQDRVQAKMKKKANSLQVTLYFA